GSHAWRGSQKTSHDRASRRGARQGEELCNTTVEIGQDVFPGQFFRPVQHTELATVVHENTSFPWVHHPDQRNTTSLILAHPPQHLPHRVMRSKDFCHKPRNVGGILAAHFLVFAVVLEKHHVGPSDCIRA